MKRTRVGAFGWSLCLVLVMGCGGNAPQDGAGLNDAGPGGPSDRGGSADGVGADADLTQLGGKDGGEASTAVPSNDLDAGSSAAGAGGSAAAGTGGTGAGGADAGDAAVGTPGSCGPCPELTTNQTSLFGSSCCTSPENECGVRFLSADCIGLDQPGVRDESCPSETLSLLITVTLEGCCRPDAQCGVMEPEGLGLGIGCVRRDTKVVPSQGQYDLIACVYEP